MKLRMGAVITAATAAICMAGIPLIAKTGAPESGNSVKSPKTDRSARSSSEGPASSQSKTQSTSSHSALQAQPQFYLDQKAAGSSAKKTLTEKTQAIKKSAKVSSSKKDSHIAGPDSIRRLGNGEETALVSGVGSSDAAQSRAVANLLGTNSPSQRPQVVVLPPQPSTSKRTMWAKLNPLNLFNRRTPRLVPTGYIQTGIASWYGSDFHGGPTASGERYDMTSLTAAHPSLPFGTLVKVTNLNNGRDVIVRVNNRGPYLRNRIIDLSKEAAKQLGMVSAGIAKVKVEVLSAVEPIEQFGQNAWRKVANR